MSDKASQHCSFNNDAESINDAETRKTLLALSDTDDFGRTPVWAGFRVPSN
jgi:hypothetical protein